MIETALTFGPEDNLVGVLTAPTEPLPSVAVLVLTSGVVHRVGPHRVSVKLARHLARQGYECMRFDVSGVGDSRNPRDATSFRLQDVRDTTAAMDWLERERGIKRFALFGICSGAVNAYASAQADTRVAAIFMLDGFIYPTWKGRAVYFAAKLRALGMFNALRLGTSRIWARLSAPRTRDRVAPDADGNATRNPSPAEFGQGMQELTDRDVQVALMFTGSVLHEYSYAGQLQDTFPAQPFLAKIACHFAPDMDHTATAIGSQQRLIDLATEWVRGAFPMASTDGTLETQRRTTVVAGAPR